MVLQKFFSSMLGYDALLLVQYLVFSLLVCGMARITQIWRQSRGGRICSKRNFYVQIG